MTASRTVDGIVVVDKPAGITSHDVVGRIRGALGGRRRGPKVGHAGTLDPMATGVLVVAIGRATRLVPWLQATTKTYEARMRFGVTTTTLDADGDEVDVVDASGLDERTVCEALPRFVGEIEQVPPMVSAVKIGGERLHVKARRGEVVERPVRRVTVHDLVLEEFLPGRFPEAGFLVTCSSGTYVRTIADDLGRAVGVGGHLTALRRLAVGSVSVADAADLNAVVADARAGRIGERLRPLAEAVSHLPAVVLEDADARTLSHGGPVPATGHDGPVAALDARGRLLAVVEDRDGAARPHAVLRPGDGSADPPSERVAAEQGTTRS